MDQLVNYEIDTEYNIPMPVPRANGQNTGIQHSIRITDDAFAGGSTNLVNHKTYYFMVLAYGFNEYAPYNSDLLTGQSKPYIASRKATFTPLQVMAGIPHKTAPQSGGTVVQSYHGQRLAVTQNEGRGAAQNALELESETLAEIMSGSPWRAENRAYTAPGSPVELVVSDPLSVVAGDYILSVNPMNAPWEAGLVTWEVSDAETGDVVHSSIHTLDEDVQELIPELGLALRVQQHRFSDSHGNYTPPISAEISYENYLEPYWRGLSDTEDLSALNWIRSGAQDAPEAAQGAEAVIHDIWPPNLASANPIPYNDPDESYEALIGGTWAPYCLTSYSALLEDGSYFGIAPRTEGMAGNQLNNYTSRIRDLNNVNIVLTPERHLWTRCPVLEQQADAMLAEGGTQKMKLRSAPSVDRYGKTVAQGGDPYDSGMDGAQPTGMGWFPGYAIDVETGERLNMAFGEDSYLLGDNGNDMLWNPSNRQTTTLGEVVAGGQHWIYVFKNTRHDNEGNDDWMPGYDRGMHLYTSLTGTSNLARLRAWKSCTWVGAGLASAEYPMRSANAGIVPGKSTIKLRIATPYSVMRPDGGDPTDVLGSDNNWNPQYHFSTRGLEPVFQDAAALDEALACINVVPNPYYAFSDYESSKLDNRIKITNLPETCTVTIFNVSGTVVRQYNKSDPLTTLDWDLKNHRNVPIASGVYLIHIDVPDVGERVLKWFGVIRPADLDNF